MTIMESTSITASTEKMPLSDVCCHQVWQYIASWRIKWNVFVSYAVPEFPANVEIKPSKTDCSEVTITWDYPKDYMYPSKTFNLQHCNTFQGRIQDFSREGANQCV